MLLFLCSGVLVSYWVCMCLGICVCCVLVVLCLSLVCVFCFLWCVVYYWLGLCSVSTSVLVGAVSIFGACPCVICWVAGVVL